MPNIICIYIYTLSKFNIQSSAPDIKVWGEDIVKLADLLISEEGVRHPHLGGGKQL